MASRYESRLAALRITDIDAPALLALVWTATAQSPALERLVGYSRDAFATASGGRTSRAT